MDVCAFATQFVVKTKEGEYLPISLGCGRCLACQRRYSYGWLVRVLSELRYSQRSCCITLTYDDAHVPSEGVSLVDCQRFLKRLRRYSSETFRYFGCLEYGSLRGRPHIHLVLLGYDFDDKMFFKRTKKGSNIYLSAFLQKCWKFGFSSVGEATPKTIPYVTKYLTKFKNHIYHDNLAPERIVMSRMPAIGAFTDDELDRGYILYLGKKYTIPSSFYASLKAKGKDVSNVMMKRRAYAERIVGDVALRLQDVSFRHDETFRLTNGL